MHSSRYNPRTVQIGLNKQLQLPKFPSSFHGNPRTCRTRFHVKHVFAGVCHVSNRSPHLSKNLPVNRVDLQIQTFQVWSPLWADMLMWSPLRDAMRTVLTLLTLLMHSSRHNWMFNYNCEAHIIDAQQSRNVMHTLLLHSSRHNWMFNYVWLNVQL